MHNARHVGRKSIAGPTAVLGATTLWAGTNAIYASRDHEDNDVLADSLNGWFTP